MKRNDLPNHLKEVLLKLLKKASYDAPFRELCLNDPEQAIRQISKRDTVPEISIIFVEEEQTDHENDDALVFTLPAFEQGRIDDDDLDTISGGKCSVAIQQSFVICID